MKRVVAFAVLSLVMVLFFSPQMARSSNLEDAKQLVEKACDFWKANGKDKAIAEFNKPHGQFTKGDLYLFGNDFNGANICNGANPRMLGANHMGLKDLNGKLFIKEMIETAKTKGSGYVDYVWTNPKTKKTQAKTAYVKKVPGTDAFIGCGLFK